MAWETRKRGGRYYFRSKRINGKVVKEYVGRADQETELIAEQDREARRRRQEAAEAVRRAENRLDEALGPLTAFFQHLDALVEAALLQAGFHCRRGQWRRRQRADENKTK